MRDLIILQITDMNILLTNFLSSSKEKKKKRRIVGEIFCDQKINTKDDTFHRRIISIKVEKYINYRRTSHYYVSQISRGKIESKQGPINRNGILEIEPRNRILDETEQARRKTSVQG